MVAQGISLCIVGLKGKIIFSMTFLHTARKCLTVRTVSQTYADALVLIRHCFYGNGSFMGSCMLLSLIINPFCNFKKGQCLIFEVVKFSVRCLFNTYGRSSPVSVGKLDVLLVPL